MFHNFGEQYVNYFTEQINNFGGRYRNKDKYVIRKNIQDPFPDKGAYFGCIRENEEHSGPYSDLSIVIFPSNEEKDENDRWMIALGVGSLGFKNDYEIATLPGTRRVFLNNLSSHSYIKNNFIDIETDDGFKQYCSNNEIPKTLENAVKNYRKVILASTLFEPLKEEESKNIIDLYLAIYSNIRRWPDNAEQRKDVQKILSSTKEKLFDEESEVKELLEIRKYIVLQGAPGTGKTRLAKKIAGEENLVYFTQFHAETSHSDFVYSILPEVQSETLNYKEHKGIFVHAIEAALDPKNIGKKVFLIIDEINRANLSNVLGPAFYLFEPTMEDSDIKIEICPGLSLSKLPDNLYVIATMNTADRSLAVLDFALRRRFAWYTLYPRKLTNMEDGKYFCEEEFSEIADFFERYATDEELNLQPGHSYFIVSQDNHEKEIKMRMKYEIMPLIKEYLMDGMLSRGKDDFINYFRQTIQEEMFK